MLQIVLIPYIRTNISFQLFWFCVISVRVKKEKDEIRNDLSESISDVSNKISIILFSLFVIRFSSLPLLFSLFSWSIRQFFFKHWIRTGQIVLQLKILDQEVRACASMGPLQLHLFCLFVFYYYNLLLFIFIIRSIVLKQKQRKY